MKKIFMWSGLVLGLVGSLTFGQDAFAFEQVEDKQFITANIDVQTEKLKQLNSQRVEKEAEKKKLDELKGLTVSFTQPTKISPEKLEQLKTTVVLSDENIEEEILNLKQAIITLSDKRQENENYLEEIVSYEKFLEKSDTEYSWNKKDLEQMKGLVEEIDKNIKSVKDYKIEINDKKPEQEVVQNLTSIKEKLSTDIKNWRSDRELLVQSAKKYLGVPYVWGGKSPSGFDCSGFVGWVYNEVLGKNITTYTVTQESQGTVIPVSEAQAGDLVFWGARGASHHVGMSLGNGSFIHAPQPGDVVKITQNGDFMPDFAVRII